MANKKSEQKFEIWLKKNNADLEEMSLEQLYAVLQGVLHAFKTKISKARGKSGTRIAMLAMELINELGEIGI